jgi:hypothetical protein
MITDDHLLVQLFCEKLRLTMTEGPKSHEETEAQLR